MDVLKYIDVLIGLALVMVLLSPMVSAITQFWMWLSNTRAGRLQVGLQSIISQLNGSPYERFDRVRVMLPTGHGLTQATLAGDGFPAETQPVAADAATFQDNIPGRLRAGNGALTFNPPLPAGATQTFLARGPIGGWTITTPPTDANGVAEVDYVFPGMPQFSSWRADVTLPANTTLQNVQIIVGTQPGTNLNIIGGTRVEYPAAVRPVPGSHRLRVTVTGTPSPAGKEITFTFARNDSFDSPPSPMLAPTPLSDDQAGEIANQVLLHPMVAKPEFWKLRWDASRRGEVVEREELIRILLGFAAGEGMDGSGLSAATRQILQNVLADNGVSDPSRALADIRAVSQVLEKSEPATALHARLTKAILTAAQSPFVGKINNWFDHVMERTTAEYRFRAQIVTVVAALIVAVAVQMDSLDLLKRLSTNDKLRDSLVQQAQDQQKRMDDQAKAAPQNQDQDEIQLAKARREEIESNLAKLRDPGIQVLPDHFVWQPLPKARLMRNQWSHPYSQRLELVLGTSVFALSPRWTDDPLADIRAAIDGAGAPVTTVIEQHRETLIHATGAVNNLANVKVTVNGTDRLVRDGGFAHASIRTQPDKNQALSLIAGYASPVELATDANGSFAASLAKSNAAVSLLPDGSLLATSPDARWIELRTRPADFRTNLLNPTDFVVQNAHLEESALDRATECAISVNGNTAQATCDFDSLVKALKAQNLDASTETRDHLVITSRRGPPIQLRSVPGHPESNMLNTFPEQTCRYICMDWPSLKQSWLGVVVTWMLLSLGAPFWYDALKDLLKLRSSVAKNEEDARKDRISDTSKAGA